MQSITESQAKTAKTIRIVLVFLFVVIIFYLIYRTIRWFETKGLAIYADTYATDRTHYSITGNPVTNKNTGCQQ